MGIAGSDGVGPTVLAYGDEFVVGTARTGLTPRLLIWKEANGIPARAPPAGVVDDVVVGVDDEAMLVEPEPHIPDNPDVSSIPEVVDTPEVAEIVADVDIPGDVDAPDDAMVPDVAPVLPPGNPPPS